MMKVKYIPKSKAGYPRRKKETMDKNEKTLLELRDKDAARFLESYGMEIYVTFDYLGEETYLVDKSKYYWFQQANSGMFRRATSLIKEK